jgi:hypothetical protein
MVPGWLLPLLLIVPMKIFFDSSAYAKRFVDEEGSDAVEALCAEASGVALSVLCVPEIISALNRRQREGDLSPEQYQMAKSQLAVEVADTSIVNILPEVITDAISILENNPVRAMDALHIACALRCHAELFVTSDANQLKAAENTGLHARRV